MTNVKKHLHRKAYLVGLLILDPENRFRPQLNHVMIASQPANSFSPRVGKEMYVDLGGLTTEGDTFHEAHAKMKETIRNHPTFTWVEPYLT